MYKLSFYIPESHLETVKRALFAEGAGHYNAYDQCCRQMLGEGQFRPLANSRPYSGKTGELEKVAKYKVEMICIDAAIKDVLETIELARIKIQSTQCFRRMQLSGNQHSFQLNGPLHINIR